MDLGGQSANPPDRPKHRLADIAGTLIALLTLTLPIFAIAYYSSSSAEVVQPSFYTLPVERD